MVISVFGKLFTQWDLKQIGLGHAHAVLWGECLRNICTDVLNAMTKCVQQSELCVLAAITDKKIGHTWTKLIELSSFCVMLIWSFYLWNRCRHKNICLTPSLDLYMTQATEGGCGLSNTYATASLQYLHFTFPEVLRPTDDSSQKPWDHRHVTSFTLFMLRKSPSGLNTEKHFGGPYYWMER